MERTNVTSIFALIRTSKSKYYLLYDKSHSKTHTTIINYQRAKKVLSDSPGLVDFAIGLVNFVFNLPDGQVMFYGEFE